MNNNSFSIDRVANEVHSLNDRMDQLIEAINNLGYKLDSIAEKSESLPSAPHTTEPAQGDYLSPYSDD